MKKEKVQLNRTDALAIERTRLANERTFLAYFRTFIVFLSSGVAILKMEVLQEIRDIGYFLTLLSPLLLIVGVVRFLYVKRQIRKFYYPVEITQ
jgi:putative membrane protein